MQLRKLFLIAAFIPVYSFSQWRSKDTLLKYLTPELELTSRKNAAFYGVAIKEAGHWLLYAVYPDTTPVLWAYFKDKNFTIKEGPYTVYYPKYHKAKEGHYYGNMMNSVWQTWYESGQLKDSGRFENNIMVGKWRSYYENGRIAVECNYLEQESAYANNDKLSQGKSSTLEGRFTRWYRNGNIEVIGNYKKEVLQGEWNWFHENGQPSTVEIYKNGKLDSITCYDTTGKYTGENCSILKPALLKNYGDYHQFILEHLSWPHDAITKNIQGDVHVKFKVTKDGQLKDLVIKGGHTILEEAVKSLFAKMTEWEPAVSHNRFIDSNEEVNIPFKRQ